MSVERLNLRHLRCVLAIVSTGTVAAAAREVHLTQPAVTQGVGRLERVLGVRLFERRSDGMVATAAGEMLAMRVARALGHVGSPRVTSAQMRAFLVVAREGGFAAASKATGLSEAALHRATADLAAALGHQLFERQGAGITLTAKGRRAKRSLGVARSELLAAVDEIEAARGRETGRIVIGAMPLARARILPLALAAFCVDHPEFSVRVIEGSHAELLGPLRDGDLDILLGALRDPAPGRDVMQEPLVDDHPVVVGRALHPLVGASLDAEVLGRYPWVVSAAGTPLRTQWGRLFEEAGAPLPRVPVECGSVMTIRELLMGSDMLTLLSRDQVTVELEAGWLAVVADAPPTLVRTVGITTRSEWVPTPLQHAFLEVLRGARRTPS